MHPSSVLTGRIEALDGLRGVAALMVVLAHGLLMQPFYWDYAVSHKAGDWSAFQQFVLFSPLRLLWDGGQAMLLFFVLSGFVLALPWINGRQRSYGQYLTARFCRLYLPYLVAMTLAAILAAMLGGGVVPGATGWVNSYGWVNSLSLLSIPSVLLALGNNYSTWINNPTWSLVVEIRIAILFPLMVYTLRWRGKGIVFLGICLWVAYELCSFFAESFPTLTAFVGAPQQTFYYSFLFWGGILLAYYSVPLMRCSHAVKQVLSAVFLAAGLWIWYEKWPYQPQMIKGIAAAFIVFSVVCGGSIARLFMVSPIQWLGKVSYSLYLVHVPVFFSLQHLSNGSLSNGVIAGVGVLLSLAVAAIFHFCVEQPAHRLGRSLMRAGVERDRKCARAGAAAVY